MAKQTPMDILKMKNTVREIKNAMAGVKSRFVRAEE